MPHSAADSALSLEALSTEIAPEVPGKRRASRSGITRKASSREAQACSKLPSSLIWVMALVSIRASASRPVMVSLAVKSLSWARFALGDFALLVVLGQSEPDGEGD